MNIEQRPQPHSALKQLDRLVGMWRVVDPSGNEATSGQTAYEWLEGGFYLLHHVHLLAFVIARFHFLFKGGQQRLAGDGLNRDESNRLLLPRPHLKAGSLGGDRRAGVASLLAGWRPVVPTPESGNRSNRSTDQIYQEIRSSLHRTPNESGSTRILTAHGTLYERFVCARADVPVSALYGYVKRRVIDLETMFQAKINFYDFKTYVYTCIYFPATIVANLPLDTYPRLRIHATIDKHPYTGALMPDKVGSNQTLHLLKEGYTPKQKIWYLQVPHKILDRIQKQVGDSVDVDFTIANQSDVDIHPAVEAILANDAALRAMWERLTPGKQRSLMYPILTAKTDRTLEKRILAFTDQLADL